MRVSNIQFIIITIIFMPIFFLIQIHRFDMEKNKKWFGPVLYITWKSVIWNTRTQHIVPEWKIVSIANFNQFFLWFLHLSRDWIPWNSIFFARELVCSLLLATWEKEYISAFVWLLLLPYDDENNYVIGQ